jgi:hypothetical protein
VVKMGLKEFLMPDWRKIVIFVILVIASGFITYLLPFTDVPLSFGFPFPFYNFGGHTMTGNYLAPHFDFLFLLIDIIISYLFSCLVAWAYDKLKKKPEEKKRK